MGADPIRGGTASAILKRRSRVRKKGSFRKGFFFQKSPFSRDSRVVIFFSLTEAPLPDPTPTPANTPKQSRNGAETEPKGVGRPGAFVGIGGGVVREKKITISGKVRDSREPPDCGKQSIVWPFSRDFRGSRDSSSEKTPFRNDPFLRSRRSLAEISKTGP